MKRRTSITTGVGDRGRTRLFSGEEISKNSLRTDAYGDIDELVSILGVARCQTVHELVREAVLYVQKSLFIIASELATTPEGLKRLPQLVDRRMLRELEGRRLVLETNIRFPDGFVIPAGTVAAAYLDLARSVARRSERKIVALFEQGDLINGLLLVWMNRLSDYLWLLARLEEGKSLRLKG